MFLNESTIAAIATPPGYGGIGIIRISGTNSLQLVKQLISKSDSFSFTPNQSVFYTLHHPETKIPIDEAVVTFFQAPHSFTGEDVVELSCHGSPVVLKEILRILTSLGSELAQPGEFTMRAFLNRKIDLTQAEAINDLIHSTTLYQSQLAVRQLKGSLAKEIKPIKDSLINTIVHFESSVEFVEDDLDALDQSRFISLIESLIEKLRHLTSTYQLGKVIRSGVRIALVGRPNVGKSSIFNRLLGRERAIVTDIPGTTRDILTENFSIKGIPIELVDTAGLRETEDKIEKLGIERTESAIAESNFVILVLDALNLPELEDLNILSEYRVKFLIINKIDLVSGKEGFIKRAFPEIPVFSVSALTGQGMAELEKYLYEALLIDKNVNIESDIITNERHYIALNQALGSLIEARENLTRGFSEEYVLVHLHEALKQLGLITGETLITDIINQIFSTFCIGK